MLYLRHACEPRDLWEWLAPHVADAEPLDTLGDGSSTTSGKFVCRTMLEPEHVERDVRFPRLPVLVHRDFTAKLVERGLARAPEGASSGAAAGDRGGHDRGGGSSGSSRGGGGGGGGGGYAGGGGGYGSSHQRDRDNPEGAKRRALDSGGAGASKPERRKCEYCKRCSCIC